jgi:hypothetical protein
MNLANAPLPLDELVFQILGSFECQGLIASASTHPDRNQMARLLTHGIPGH